MKKIILITICLPVIGFSQSYCSLLNVVDVTTDTNNMINIAISDEGFGNSYPYIAYSINSLGDTTHFGYLDLFGNAGFDTTWYSYSIISSPIYPLSIHYVYGINSDTCILNYHPSCDSVSVFFNFIDSLISPNQIHVNIETLNFGNSNFGYGGFVLLNELGDTVASENINNAGNVYGLMQNYTENRFLDLSQIISIPFNGALHLISGFFAGNSITSCVFPFNITNEMTSMKEYSTNKKLLKVTDILGRKTENLNQPLIYFYDDGSVEKSIIIK